MKSRKQKSKIVKPGGVEKYISGCPKDLQKKLQEIRSAIREVAPDAVETVSYFDIPGYSIEGFDYNGMFAWFSFKSPFVRLHVRPFSILKHKKLLEKYTTSKAIVNFPLKEKIPSSLVKKLVKASMKDMIASTK